MKFKSKLAVFLALVLLCGVVFVVFAADDGTDDDAASTETEDEGTKTIASFVVNTIADMTALQIEETNAVILVKGYYTPGDGGGGEFYWQKSSRAIANGGTAFKPNDGPSGRFIRVYDQENVNVKWFGAMGDGKTDDSEAFNKAIDALPLLGGTLTVPNGTYNIGSTVIIGDGNMGSQNSSRKGIHVVGDGNAVLRATTALDTVIDVKGLIHDVLISGVKVDCDGKAKTGVRMTAFMGCAIRNSSITGFTDKGLIIMGGGAPVGNYNIYNQFENLNISSSVDGATAIYFNGDYEIINDTWLTTFTNCSFVATGKDSIGAHYKFVDSISFYQCTFSGTRSGILLDATENNDFPCGMAFYDCSVSNVDVLESEGHVIRKHWFYGFRTDNGEELPSDGRLFGITDEGKTFHMDSIY